MNTIDLVNDLTLQLTEFIPGAIINKMSWKEQLQCIEWHYNADVLKPKYRLKNRSQYDRIISTYA